MHFMMAQTTGLRQFLILIYKGMLLRKRHYVVTFFEIVFPVLIASIAAIILSESSSPNSQYRDYNRDGGGQWKSYTTYEPSDPLPSEISSNDLMLVYTPSNDVTDNFMKATIMEFTNRTDFRGDISIKDTKTEEELEIYCLLQKKNKPYLTIIGTVFNNFDRNLPDSLDYKIRFNNENYGSSSTPFNTQLKYAIDGPQRYQTYEKTFFIYWQTVVEETFIQKKLEKEHKVLPYKIKIQRFPYPDHKDNRSDFNVINILPWAIGYGYLMFIMNIVRRVTEEKANGSKELLKMMGMTDFVYWTSTFMNYFIIAFITMLIITIVYKAPLKNSTVVLPHSDFMLLFLMLLLFMASLILFSMLVSIFFNKPVFAILALIVVYLVCFCVLMVMYFLPDQEINYLFLSPFAKLSMCLFPGGALMTMFFIISFFESVGDGAKWSNLTEFNVVPDLNMLMVIGVMIFSCFFYAALLWYFDAVWPWQPGVPKPFYFLFTRSYWHRAKASETDEMQLTGESDNSSDFFEQEPTGTSAGVIIKNLSKDFRTGMTTKLAVNNVSLNMYQGQITALLGHNGAGKTTTINVLTGLYTPCSGTAYINGFDILVDTMKARRGIGVCPQHNVLYDTLTVEEHLTIYAAIKGVPWRQIKKETSNVINILNLMLKRNELIKTLSGGMKRKLSLGIAIIGGSKVLFLDEPTSGMDVEARRSVWDTLMDLRHDRTIILTTHYMEEADILGDRIAIMAEGEIQCCGSPIFLKQKFGTGYHLHVLKNVNFDSNSLRNLLGKFIPGVTLKSEMEKEITFNLASNTGEGFGEMFQEIENHKMELGVMSYGLTITTMEDVFLNVANMSDIKYKLHSTGDKRKGIMEFEDVYGESGQFKNHRGLGNQLLGILCKNFHYAKRQWGILIAQLVVPFLLMCLCLYIISISDNQFRTTFKPLRMDIKSVYGKTDGFFFNRNGKHPEWSKILTNVYSSNGISTKDVSDPSLYILDYGKKDISKYIREFLVGAAFDEYPDGTMNLTAWFNGEPYHALPMSLLLMHNVLLNYVTGTGSISLTNSPLPRQSKDIRDDEGKIMERIMGSVFAPLALAFLSGSFILLPIHERISKAKLLQLMSGLPAVLYWIGMFLWDFLIHVIVCLLLIIPFSIFSHHVFFAPHSEAIGTAFLLMLFYGWASIPLGYLMSLVFKNGSSGFAAIVGMSVVFGSGAGSILMSLQTIGKEVEIAAWFFRILPTFSLSSSFANLFAIAYNNAFCDGVPERSLEYYCDSTMDHRNPVSKCCKNICNDNCLKQVYPLTWDKFGCGRDVFFLALDGAIFFSVLILLETNTMAPVFRALQHHYLKVKKSISWQIMRENFVEDSDVLREEERIRNLRASAISSSGGEALSVLGLTKVFRNFYGVDHLTFGIHPKECFGLLGVNGAGKTTTFQMLTGDCSPTVGNAFIQNSSVLTDLKKFQSYLGYCPQFDALIDRLTGREMLTLFARLRGLSGHDLKVRVNKFIGMTDLTDHADKQTRFYSGGNKRKLSVGIALIGSPPLILLDEPTAGVDPVSRRKIWNILSQARSNTGAAVILTTHSMEESEALCSRLAIMVNGRFRCLGSIQQLKSKYGQGYTLIIKLNQEDQNDIRASADVKEHISRNLRGAELKDDHQGMLQYHVVDPSVTLSGLFNFMSTVKSHFKLEDYLISDTSLEQIFLTFARAQRISAN